MWTGSGTLKEVTLALCGVECNDLMFNAVKILSITHMIIISKTKKTLYI